MSEAWPTELRFQSEARQLSITFDDGFAATLPYELLRVESPSADVQGHGGAQKTIVPGKRDVSVVTADPVGRYAIRIKFDDGHHTGLFSWVYLRQLAENRDEVMATYLAALADNGLSRT